MAENSKIGWTHHTFNPWVGCNHVSSECRFCYIGPLLRWTGREPFNGPMRTVNWKNPFKWERQAKKDGRRFRIFTCSMSDFFHPGADQWRDEAWEVIKACPNLDWLILTKRPELLPDRLPSDWGNGYPNVWLGVTCGVASSLTRIPLLKQIPAHIRFISAEPLLERVDFRPYLDGSINWVITGCEQAGKDKRRPMDIDWVRDIDRQCRDAGVAHFFKQRYEGTKITFDGLLNGVVKQELPS